MQRQLIVLACVLVMLAGCGKHRLWKKKEKPLPQQSGMMNIAQAPASAADLAGTWNLQMPGGHRGTATIAASDPTHVTINAGGNLSGNYLVQGQHLLVLTNDERLRPLAWQIMSPDSLMLTRAPAPAAVGSDYTGSTLTRAGAAAAPAPR